MKRAGLWLVSIAICSSIVSQETRPGRISGILKDSRTHQPLAEAVITVSSDKIEGKKLALTDSTGTYTIGGLPPGYYSICFEMEGYKRFTKDSIRLQEGMSLGVSLEMARTISRTSKVQ